MIRRIEAAGAIFVREGGSHTVYQNPRTGLLLSVPRHREISEKLARTIIREAKK